MTTPADPLACDPAEHHHCYHSFQTNPDCEDCRQMAVAYERWSKEMDAADKHSRQRLKIEKDWPKDLKRFLKHTRSMRTQAENALRSDERNHLNDGAHGFFQMILATSERNLAAFEQPIPPWNWRGSFELYVDPREDRTLN